MLRFFSLLLLVTWNIHQRCSPWNNNSWQQNLTIHTLDHVMVETNPFAFAFVCLTVVCVQSVTFFVSLVCGEDFWSSSLFNCACFRLLLLLLLWSWYRCWCCWWWWWWWCWSLLVALPPCLFHFISSFCVSYCNKTTNRSLRQTYVQVQYQIRVCQLQLSSYCTRVSLDLFLPFFLVGWKKFVRMYVSERLKRCHLLVRTVKRFVVIDCTTVIKYMRLSCPFKKRTPRNLLKSRAGMRY